MKIRVVRVDDGVFVLSSFCFGRRDGGKRAGSLISIAKVWCGVREGRYYRQRLKGNVLIERGIVRDIQVNKCESERILKETLFKCARRAMCMRLATDVCMKQKK